MMAPDKLGMAPHQQIRKELTSVPHMVFPEAFALGHHRSTATPDSKAATFLGHNYLQPPPPQPSRFRQQWNSNSRSSADDSKEDDAEVENDDDDAQGGEEINLENMVTLAKISDSDRNHRYGAVNSCGDVKYIVPPGDGPSSSGQKDDRAVGNSCGINRKKDGWYSSESRETLRAILSDPLTGALMEDAMILPCGHSYGSGGIQQIVSMKACYTCSQPVLEDSISPNLSLRLAVQAFSREEGFYVNTSKRRRDRYLQDKGGSGDSTATDYQERKRIQFPFAVTDRVIIKGNKRTPERFFGREAVVTAQCLNGWYIVKTLDNAESVKLQYRSLAKVPEKPTAKPSTTNTTPNWLRRAS